VKVEGEEEEEELGDNTGSAWEYQQAISWWEELALTLVRCIVPDLETLLGLKAIPNLDGLFNGKKSPLLLPFNILTWKELARQGLVAAILREIGFTGESWGARKGRTMRHDDGRRKWSVVFTAA